MVTFDDYKVSGPITRPWYVIELRLGQQTVRLSTGDEAEWGDDLFEAGRIEENGFEVDDDSLRLRLINDDFIYSAAALRGDFHGGEVHAWYTPKDASHLIRFLPDDYVMEGYEDLPTPVVPIAVFSGTISEITQIGKVIGISALRRKLGGFPSVRIVPPFANHVATPGTKLTLNNTIYLVEKR